MSGIGYRSTDDGRCEYMAVCAACRYASKPVRARARAVGALNQHRGSNRHRLAVRRAA